MAGNVVRILLTAKDEVSAQLDKVRDKAGLLAKTDIGKGFSQGLGIAAMTKFISLTNLAAFTVKDFFEGSVTAAIEEEAGMARLTAALKANVDAWNGNTAAIEAAFKARMRLGFSDDEMRDSLSRLVAATHDVDEAFTLQATAMDLARFKGISLAEASDALIKVEAGQYRILKSLGIVLRDGATQTEALAAVQKVAGGQAQAFSQTTQGAMLGAKVAIEDLQAEIGEGLLPVVKDLATFTRDTGVPAILGLKDAVGEASKAFSFWGGVLDVTLDFLTPWDGVSNGVSKRVRVLTHEMIAAADATLGLKYALSRPGTYTFPIVRERDPDTGRRAAGGPIAPYGTAIVGERGPELIRLGSAGASVSPGVAGAVGSGGSLTVNVSTPVMTPGSAEELARLLGPMVTRWQQARGLV